MALAKKQINLCNSTELSKYNYKSWMSGNMITRRKQQITDKSGLVF